MNTFKIFTLVLFHSIVFNSVSQTLDQNFQLSIPIRAADIGHVKVQDDGKILVSGNIRFFDNQRVYNLIRLNEDGTLDETFSFMPDSVKWIGGIGVLSTGEIIVSGPSTLMKLSSSGEILHEIDSIKDINSINIQDDDKIVVTASKVFIWNSSTGFLYRFNSDLSLDESFNQTNSFNGWIFDATLQDDKIIVAGNFSEVNGTVKNDLVRFESDGTLDHGFDSGTGTSAFIMSITVQPDGKILLGGSSISSFNSTHFNYTGIIRINTDGTVDTEFNADNRVSSIESKPVFQGSDILIGGYFNISDGDYGEYVYRLKSNGSFDSTFIPIKLYTWNNEVIAFTIPGDIIINNTHLVGNEYGLSKFSKNGQLDQNFNPKLGTFGEINTGDYYNGQLVVGGRFIRIGEVKTKNLAKFHSDGTVDASFVVNPSLTAYNANHLQPSQIKIIDENKILVALGDKLVSINSKGVADENFTSQGIADPFWFVSKFSFLEDDKIVASDGNGVFMLNADGTQDLSFDIPDFDISSTAFDCDVQSSGIIYASNFTKINDLNINGFVRLNFDGSVDQTFDAGNGVNNLRDINVFENDEILVTGFFEQFDGVAARGLVKLSKNGQVDEPFTSNYNTTAPEGFTSGYYNTSFREGFIISSFNPTNRDCTLGFVHADGTFNANYSLPDQITLVEREIVPIVVNADSVILLSKFQINGNSDPSFVLRLVFDDRPKITGTTSALSTPEETPIGLSLSNLIVTDSDSTFPDDFTLVVYEGNHYAVEDSIITPEVGFIGKLIVPVAVNDGTHTSDIFNITIEVTPVDDTSDSISVVLSGDSTITNNPLISITFSERVDDFQSSDISVTNGVVSELITEDSITFTADISPVSDGKITAIVSSVVVYNKSGHTNQVSNVFTFVYDGTNPTVTVTGSEGDTNSTAPFSLVITFNEPVTGFTAEDIQVSNASVSEVVSTDSTSFLAQIIPDDFGKITVIIPSGAVQDQAGNDNKVSEDFYLFYVKPYFTLTVEVTNHNQEGIPAATVTLYQKVNGRFVVVAKKELSGDSYTSFEGLLEGEYTVGIWPEDSNFLPAYLGDKFMLLDAKTITLHQANLLYISLIAKPNLNSIGESVIAGILLRSENSSGRILTGSAENTGEAVADAPVYLMHPESGEILSYAITDEQGKFTFTGLQSGAYLFVADCEGLPNDEEQNLITVTSDFETVTITAIAGDQVRIIEKHVEKQVTAVKEDIPHHAIHYYPNPVTDEIITELPSPWIEGEIKISDASGKILKTQKIIAKTTKINMEQMSSGIYTLILSKGNVHQAFKIFKQ